MSRDGRLLFFGLISLADDDGRFRALPSVILGHWYPYDSDAPRKLQGWLDELVARSMTVLYEVEGVRYGFLPRFTAHQKINRPTPSLLPEPVVSDHVPLTDQSLNDHGTITEASPPRTRGGDRRGRDRIGSEGKGASTTPSGMISLGDALREAAA